MKIFRVWRVFLFALVAIPTFANPSSAYAHGIGSLDGSSTKSIITNITPATHTFSIKSIENGERIQIERKGKETITVLGIDGEQYLQLRESGVYLNEKSSTRVINLSTSNVLNHNETKAEFQKTSSDKNVEPVWEKVSSGSRYTWHDHRAHYMGSVPDGVTSLGTSALSVRAGETNHVVTIEFESRGMQRKFLFVGVLIFCVIAIVSWAHIFRNHFVRTITSKTVIALLGFVIALEIIHIVSYCMFAQQSLGTELVSVLYGLIFLVCAGICITLLVFRSDDTPSQQLSRHAPIVTLSGILGVSVGTLLEYRTLFIAYPASALPPLLTRIFIIAIGCISLVIGIIGSLNIPQRPNSASREITSGDSIPSK